MSDPKHLTDEGGDATDFERELLLAAQEVGLSTADKQAIWAGVALQALPAATVSPAASGSIAPGTAAAKAGVTLAPWLKGLLLVCGLGGISAGIYSLKHTTSAVVQDHSVASSFGGSLLAPTASAELAPNSLPVVASAPAVETVNPAGAPSANHDSSPVESKSALREESLAVLEIRRTLRAGDANGALRLLEQARQRFPHGALSQEREALNIEALAKSGAHEAAARQAEAFLRAHPKSPYAADVQSFKSK